MDAILAMSRNLLAVCGLAACMFVAATTLILLFGGGGIGDVSSAGGSYASWPYETGTLLTIDWLGKRLTIDMSQLLLVATALGFGGVTGWLARGQREDGPPPSGEAW